MTEAMGLISGFEAWLRERPCTTHEIVAALFKFYPFARNPEKVDLFFVFSKMMNESGFKASGRTLRSAIWHPMGKLGEGNASGPSTCNPSYQPVAVRQWGTLPVCQPKGFQRLLEFMVFINEELTYPGYFRTVEIAKLLFPDADQQVMDTWLIKAIHDCMYRIGFTPVGTRIGEDERCGVFDDPEWFCDGDPKETLWFNLWEGTNYTVS
jgi:hypothetical protein